MKSHSSGFCGCCSAPVPARCCLRSPLLLHAYTHPPTLQLWWPWRVCSFLNIILTGSECYFYPLPPPHSGVCRWIRGKSFIHLHVICLLPTSWNSGLRRPLWISEFDETDFLELTHSPSSPWTGHMCALPDIAHPPGLFWILVWCLRKDQESGSSNCSPIFQSYYSVKSSLTCELNMFYGSIIYIHDKPYISIGILKEWDEKESKWKF